MLHSARLAAMTCCAAVLDADINGHYGPVAPVDLTHAKVGNVRNKVVGLPDFAAPSMPFVRAGVSHGQAARADKAITIGTLFRPDNQIGEYSVALGWESLSDNAFGNQSVVEAFFRWDASGIVQITPSIQAIFDTPLSADGSTEIVFGLRTRIAF